MRLVSDSDLPSEVVVTRSPLGAAFARLIACPVLVIGAEHDRTVVHNFQLIAEFYNSDRLFVPEAGHDFMLEPAAIDVAIRINHWLLSVLPDEGLQISNA